MLQMKRNKHKDETVTERLLLVMDHLGIARDEPSALGKICRVKRQNVNGWIRKGATPQLEALMPLYKIYSINPVWILTGEGSMQAPLFLLPEANKELFDFVASLSDEEATIFLRSFRELREAMHARNK